MFLCEIYKFRFSFLCREMSSDDEEVGTWWMYFHFSVLLNFILSICCLFFYRNHYHQKFLKLSRLTLKVSDNIMLLFNICRQQEDGKIRVQSLLRMSKMSVKWHVHVPRARYYAHSLEMSFVQGWGGKTRVKSPWLLRISEMSVKHHVPPAAFFSLLPWSAEMYYPSDYSCLCLQFQKTEIQRKPRKR